jgi:hypothetical protein
MSFSVNMAKVVTDQLARFVTLNRHQLAGHVANLDFWVAQARHALAVIDGYQDRFRRLKVAQDKYVAAHEITIPSRLDPDIKGRPASPSRVPDASLREARRSLVDATYGFLLRLYRDRLISESQLRNLCGDLGIGIDPVDVSP